MDIERLYRWTNILELAGAARGARGLAHFTADSGEAHLTKIRKVVTDTYQVAGKPPAEGAAHAVKVVSVAQNIVRSISDIEALLKHLEGQVTEPLRVADENRARTRTSSGPMLDV